MYGSGWDMVDTFRMTPLEHIMTLMRWIGSITPNGWCGEDHGDETGE